MVVHRSVAWLLGLPHEVALSQELFIFSFALAMMAIFAGARLAISALAYLCAYVVAGTRPEWVYEETACANLVALSAIAVIWRR
jgi:hypothetical protein